MQISNGLRPCRRCVVCKIVVLLFKKSPLSRPPKLPCLARPQRRPGVRGASFGRPEGNSTRRGTLPTLSGAFQGPSGTAGPPGNPRPPGEPPGKLHWCGSVGAWAVCRPPRANPPVQADWGREPPPNSPTRTPPHSANIGVTDPYRAGPVPRSELLVDSRHDKIGDMVGSMPCKRGSP